MFFSTEKRFFSLKINIPEYFMINPSQAQSFKVLPNLCNVSSSYYWEGRTRAGVIPNHNLQHNTQVLARKTATGTFAE